MRCISGAFSPQAWGCTADQIMWRRGTTASFSPQAWGCTADCPLIFIARLVFPTGVGVYRVQCRFVSGNNSFPHRRGGVPRIDVPRSLRVFELFSPQAWGCTGLPCSRIFTFRCFPHRRGGVPSNPSMNLRPRRFSPQAWGCTARNGLSWNNRCQRIVFPTGVGVYRVEGAALELDNQESFPHRRGGVP